jgi:hypothetical protein
MDVLQILPVQETRGTGTLRRRELTIVTPPCEIIFLSKRQQDFLKKRRRSRSLFTKGVQIREDGEIPHSNAIYSKQQRAGTK